MVSPFIRYKHIKVAHILIHRFAPKEHQEEIPSHHNQVPIPHAEFERIPEQQYYLMSSFQSLLIGKL
jgi:hypothetical protein